MSFRNNRDFPNRSGNSVSGNWNNYGRNNPESNNERNYRNMNSGGIRGGFAGHRGRGSHQTSNRGNYSSGNNTHRNWQRNNRSDGCGNNNNFQKFRGTNELQTVSNEPDTTETQSVPGHNSIAPNPKPKESSTSSSSDTDSSEDSAVRSLKNVVKTSLLVNKPTDTEPQLSATVTEAKKVVEPKKELKNSNVKETATKVDNGNKSQTASNKVISNMKKEANSKSENSESSSSSTESSSEEDSSSSEADNDRSKAECVTNEEEVICLGNLEKFENLVDEESNEAANKTCLLCDKSGHISFHCQMICKNCSGKYHGLKDCPKPANLSIVFSNFMQFCLNQSCRYNPNGDFIIDGNTSVSPSSKMQHFGQLPTLHSTKRKKSRAQTASKRSDSSSSNSSSGSRSQMSSSRKKKRRKNSNSNVKSASAAMQFCNTMPYVAPTGNFNPLNSLLAIGHMLGGYNPAPMAFQNSPLFKD